MKHILPLFMKQMTIGIKEADKIANLTTGEMNETCVGPYQMVLFDVFSKSLSK